MTSGAERERRAADRSPRLETLRAVTGGDFRVMSRSRDDRRWLVDYTLDDVPESWWLYDRPTRTARKLLDSNPALDSLPLAKLHPVVIPSRDSLELVSYVCLPRWSDLDGDGRPAALAAAGVPRLSCACPRRTSPRAISNQWSD